MSPRGLPDLKRGAARVSAPPAWRATLGTRWQALSARERRSVTILGLALAAVLLWLLALQPALRTLREVPLQRAELDEQLAAMRALAAETTQLRALPAIGPEQAEAALKSATATLGEAARLSVTNDRATVTFTAISPQALMAWLGDVRSAARASVVELRLTRSAKGYSGSAVLALPHSP